MKQDYIKTINQLIELRSILSKSVDLLELERLESDKKKHQLNLLIKYLEQASIEAGTLLRDLREQI